MAAVASARHSAGSPHLAANKSLTASPRSQPARSTASDSKPPPASASPVQARDHNAQDSKDSRDTKDTHHTTNAPLAPPPKPSESGAGNGSSNGNSEYFASQHNPAHLAKEPNPFENAFGTADTPGKTPLPGVTSLTSPAPLLPAHTPGWPGSLRSGPLSPAMLAGPTGSNDYFNSDHHFAGSFPTPNESSLRTGLTPGGGGSMFPQPSPNSQALYNQLQSGGATPGTLDFHRTAMTARAQSQASQFGQQHQNGGATSQPQNNSSIQPDLDNPQSQQRQDAQDPFGSHQTTDAANGLYMLAQAGGQHNPHQQQQYNSAQQQQRTYAQGNQGVMDDRVAKNSIVSTVSGSNDGEEGRYTDGEDGAGGNKSQAKRSKKGGSNTKAASNGKRKTDETPSKPPAGKKHRGSTGSAMMMDPDDEEDEDEDGDEMRDMITTDGRKMTDEEKRKNFLERNRIAALKCRQRKKQWLQNLQQKVEIFSTENDALAATVSQLREEIVGLKTLLLAHKDCPVSQAQGIAGMTMQQIAGDAGQGHYANPYGMAGHAQQQMQQAGMQRR